MAQPQGKKNPHVVIVPFPLQGHINSMLKLAQLLCLADFRVTFINSDHNHDRLICCSDLHTQVADFPGIQFAKIPDGLPMDHPRSASLVMEIFDSFKTKGKESIREMLISYRQSDGPVTCIIADGLLTYLIDVGDELGIPVIMFRTISASALWAYFNIPKLIEAGELPFQDDADMDHPIKCVPGMEAILRRRDLPSFCRAKETRDPLLQVLVSETINSTRARALILNTVEDLEGPILTQIRAHWPTTYTVGPLHALFKSRLTDSIDLSSSLWKEDKTCMTWLDSQPSNSVLYVSFGSLSVVTRDELLEFWHGLVNSHTRFLWVVRPDLVEGKGEVGHVPDELLEATNERGFLVEWAPQKEVLAHPAIGGFLTHSGWNSTLESVLEGVPMLCWAFFADQQTNSRYVGDVWRIGLDMKDKSDRWTVERMVRDLMHGRRDELKKSADKIASLARKCVSHGGSSFANLDGLTEDIRSMIS